MPRRRPLRIACSSSSIVIGVTLPDTRVRSSTDASIRRLCSRIKQRRQLGLGLENPLEAEQLVLDLRVTRLPRRHRSRMSSAVCSIESTRSQRRRPALLYRGPDDGHRARANLVLQESRRESRARASGDIDGSASGAPQTRLARSAALRPPGAAPDTQRCDRSRKDRRCLALRRPAT